MDTRTEQTAASENAEPAVPRPTESNAEQAGKGTGLSPVAEENPLYTSGTSEMPA